MTNELHVDGNYNVTVQGVNDSTINVIIGRSADYNKLHEDLLRIQANLEDVAPERVDRIAELNAQKESKEAEIKRFEADVIRLAEAFTKININTERLRKAKAYFDNGKFKEANAILELKEIEKDQKTLLAAKEKKEEELQELTNQLLDNSNEYYIKAQVVSSFNYTSVKYADVFNLYKWSIKSNSNLQNNSGLGAFLIRNQRYKIALPYLLKALDYEDTAEPREIAALLNMIGLAYKEQRLFKEAEKQYRRSLEIMEGYIDTNDKQLMHNYGTTIMNVGILYIDNNQLEKGLTHAERAIQIYRDYPEDSNRYYNNLAAALNNLGKYYSEKKDFNKQIEILEEGVTLRRKIIQTEPVQYAFHLARLLCNLALAETEKENYIKAEEYNEEVALHYERYEKLKIYSHRLDFLLMLMNIAYFYTDNYKNKDKALYYANKTADLLIKSNPHAALRMHVGRSLDEIFTKLDRPNPLDSFR